MQGCRLARATLTSRLLILVLVSKKFHPCSILGHHEMLVCHQSWWDPPASKGSFSLGDSGPVLLSKASSQQSVPHPGRAVERFFPLSVCRPFPCIF